MVKYWRAGETLNAVRLNELMAEKAYNHTGNTSNYWNASIGGTGSFTTYSATEPKLSMGARSNTGYAWYFAHSYFYISNAYFVVFNAIVDPITGNRTLCRDFIGLKFDMSSYDLTNIASFVREDIINGVANWYCYAATGTPSQFTKILIPTIKEKSLFSIVWDSSSCNFFVNGELVASISTTLPTDNMSSGIGCTSTSNAAAGSLDVYMMNIEIYPY